MNSLEYFSRREYLSGRIETRSLTVNTVWTSENRFSEESAAVVYLLPEDHEGPELLIFDEKLLKRSGWQRASKKSKQIWERMKERYDQIACDIFATDRFLGRLRSFRKVTVLLTQPIEPAIVKERLKTILRDRSYHHLRWLIIDLILLPFALIPMFLPGPNILGYYLLFRVFSHWKSYRHASATNLESLEVEVSNQAQEVSAFIRKKENMQAALHDLRRKYGLRALQEHQFIPLLTTFRQALSRMRDRRL